MKKIHAQRIHSKDRAMERYGIELNRHDLRNIADIVKNKRAFWIADKTNRISIYKVEYKTVEMWIAYDNNSLQVASFLPRGAKW